jgi:hypothetical protein
VQSCLPRFTNDQFSPRILRIGLSTVPDGFTSKPSFFTVRVLLTTASFEMESDDLEDMLFGLEASQGSFEDAISDFSDDEMLDAPDEEELILWETQEDSLLTPTSIDQQVEGNVGKEQPQMHHRVRPVRDRWLTSSTYGSFTDYS